jgi:hypothetical protein
MGLRRAQLALGFVVSALCAAVPTAAWAQDIGCDRGDLEVSRVDFVGNRTFDDAQLANGLVTTPSSWARRVLRKIGTRRCLDTLEVQRDPLRLLVLYRRRGFPSATVSARIDTVRPSTVAVTFRIQEGDHRPRLGASRRAIHCRPADPCGWPLRSDRDGSNARHDPSPPPGQRLPTR